LITDDMQKILMDAPIWVLATADPDGTPNAIPIRFHEMMDDRTFVFVDNFMKQTLRNIEGNPKVAVTAWVNLEGYQFKGTGHYLTSGPIFEAGHKKAKDVNAMLPGKGVLVVSVDEVYCQSPGPKAGVKVS